MISVPTTPAYPATSVTFQRDEKTGDVAGGTTVVIKDPTSGQDVARWQPIAPIVIKATN